MISGSSKGKTGKIREVIRDRDLVIVDGVNLRKRHERPRKANQKGQTVEKAMPIHVSNVALIEGGKPVRSKMRLLGEKRVRVSRKTGKEI